MVIAYKAFDKNLSCRGYVFSENTWNEEVSATCQSTGLHAALNPLDCLSYYSWDGKNRFFIVSCDGEIHHQGTNDTKIASTKMRLEKELSLEEYILESMKYVYNNPYEPLSKKIHIDVAEGKDERFLICYGKNPVVKGKKGQIVGLIQAYNQEIIAMDIFKIDGVNYLPNKFYNIDGLQA